MDETPITIGRGGGGALASQGSDSPVFSRFRRRGPPDVSGSPPDDLDPGPIREALTMLRFAGDNLAEMAYPGGVARSPLPPALAEAVFSAFSSIADGEAHLRAALRLMGADPGAERL